MKITVKHTDGRAVSTGPLMREMVECYYRDMTPYAHLTLEEIFNVIKNVPYKPDPPELETLQRPYYTMNRLAFGGDCDDKAICLASYAKLLGIPYRFIAVRKCGRKTLHHVVCELMLNGQWVHADATYSVNTLGRERDNYCEKIVI